MDAMASKSAFIWVVMISTCPALIAYSSTGFLLPVRPVYPDVFNYQRSAISKKNLQSKKRGVRSQQKAANLYRASNISNSSIRNSKSSRCLLPSVLCRLPSVLCPLSPLPRVYLLCPRMVFLMHLPEPFPRNMCIYLGSAYVGMTQHHLHRAQVCPTFEKMGSERVSQGVRSE